MSTLNEDTGLRAFQFSDGQHVDHILGGMPSIVTGRARTKMDREQYEVRDNTGRVRHFLGAFLVAA